MVDNFNVITELLKFESEDEFYFLQIIKRKKENPELGSNSRIIKTYYIKSVEHLTDLYKEIITLCDLHNARACINLNRRSFENIAFHTLRKVTDILMNRDYNSVKQAYDSICGTYSAEKEKKWIIDIDHHDDLYGKELAERLANIRPIGDKLLKVVPSKNGYHLIVKPFDIQEAKEKIGFTDDIHKDNPTILYIP